jgi:hypothetical protein
MTRPTLRAFGMTGKEHRGFRRSHSRCDMRLRQALAIVSPHVRSELWHRNGGLEPALRRLVRNQRRLEADDRVLQLQLAFLQALDRQFVGDDVLVQAGDGQVEVAVLQAQFGQPLGDSGEFGRV